MTSNIDHTIQRIDPRSGRPVGKPVETPLNPYALTLTGDSLWLTAVVGARSLAARYPD